MARNGTRASDSPIMIPSIMHVLVDFFYQDKVIYVLKSVVLSVEPAVKGAPAIVLLLDDVLQAVDDQLVELYGGMALAAALLGAEVPVVQLKAGIQ